MHTIKTLSPILIFFLMIMGCSKQPEIQDGLYQYISSVESDSAQETEESNKKGRERMFKLFEKHSLDKKQGKSVFKRMEKDVEQTLFAMGLVASPYMQTIEIKGDKAIFHYDLFKKGKEVTVFDRSSNQIMVELDKGAIISADVVAKKDGISFTNIRFPIEPLLKGGKKADWKTGLSDEAVSDITSLLAERLGELLIPKSMFYESYITGMKNFDVSTFMLNAAEVRKVVGYKGDIKSWDQLIEDTIINPKYETYIDGEGRKKLLLTGKIDQYRLVASTITNEQENDDGAYNRVFKRLERFGFKRNEQFATIKLEVALDYVKKKDGKYSIDKVVPYGLTANGKEFVDLKTLIEQLALIKLDATLTDSFLKITEKAAQIGKASGSSDDKKVAKQESGSTSSTGNSVNRASKVDLAKLDMFGSALYQNIKEDKNYKKSPKPVFMFDCAKPKGKMEKLICGDFDLQKIDNEMQKVYRISANLIEDENSLKIEQMSWMTTERDICDSKECLINSYANRMEQMSMSMEEM